VTASLIAAALAGLVGSPHCAGMCGGFAVACGGSVGRSAAWHAGKLSTYAALGALAGAFGALLPGTGGLAAAVSALLVVLFAALLGGWLPEPRMEGRALVRIGTRARRVESRRGSFLFGVANGFLPCGLVWAALALPLASGSALVGAATMTAFGLGTVPVLAAVTAGARRIALHDMRMRRLVALGVLVSGLLSIGLREGLVPSAGHDHTLGAATHAAGEMHSDDS